MKTEILIYWLMLNAIFSSISATSCIQLILYYPLRHLKDPVIEITSVKWKEKGEGSKKTNNLRMFQQTSKNVIYIKKERKKDLLKE